MVVDERRLVGRAVRGDEAAFACLVEYHQRSIYQLCYRVLGDAGEAEDAAQETFLRAFLHLRRFDRARSLRTWLCAIAHHHCIDLLRRRRLVWLSLESDPPLEHAALRDPAPGPEPEVERREQAAQVQRLLSHLPPASRAVITLHYWSGLSYREIAQATGSTVSAVKSRLHRSRAALAAMLAAERRAAPSRWQPVWEPA
jgi:RNA polymerase sigma-70 factor (ECF subfamily)